MSLMGFCILISTLCFRLWSPFSVLFTPLFFPTHDHPYVFLVASLLFHMIHEYCYYFYCISPSLLPVFFHPGLGGRTLTYTRRMRPSLLHCSVVFLRHCSSRAGLRPTPWGGSLRSLSRGFFSAHAQLLLSTSRPYHNIAKPLRVRA